MCRIVLFFPLSCFILGVIVTQLKESTRYGGIAMNKLTRSSTDKVLTGVCGGIAAFFGIDSLIVRLIFIFIPGSVAIYLILTLLLPEDPSLY
jgi:phage shock protein PspC (stress-responsive transcriptional regulator)